jgi:tellurite resistance protein
MVSHADGSLHEREANMVRRLAGVMRLDPARTEAVMRVIG